MATKEIKPWGIRLINPDVVNLSHMVKAPMLTVVNFYAIGKTEVHASGCAHEGKADSKTPPQTLADFLATILVDDFYNVAPCARKSS